MQAEVAGSLHAEAMAAGTGDEAWKADAIARLLGTAGIFGFLALAAEEEPAGFVLARTAVDEAEILTLAVAPGCRRRGIARRLMMEAIGTARARGAEKLLLEVALDNEPARRLYASLGFSQVGRRTGYYSRAGGGSMDSLVLAAGIRDR